MFHMDDTMNMYLSNGPVKVNFAGLKGTTHSMTADGWQLNFQQEMRATSYGLLMRIAGSHKGLDLQCYSAPYVVSMEAIHRSQDMMSAINDIEFSLLACARAITLQIAQMDMPRFSRANFQDVQMRSFETFRLEDLCIFRPSNEEADVYVPKSELWTAQKHLDALLEFQKPKQKELREKYRRKRNSTEGAIETPDSMTTDPNKNDVKLTLIAV